MLPVRPRRRLVLWLAVLVVGPGCSRRSAPPEPAPVPAPAPEPVAALAIDTTPIIPLLITDTILLQDPELEARIERLELRLLEREAQVTDLQARLDQARQEAVRAMAKLQSLATRAEGASGIAEAEVAVQALRNGSGGRQSSEYTQAKRLLDQSSMEFNRQNYGGAVYLANLARGLAGAGRGRVSEGRPRGGETRFATPVPLVVVSRCNVREGPGTSSRVLYTLDQGASVTGLSWVEGWVRITAGDGRGGWVSRALVGGAGGAVP